MNLLSVFLIGIGILSVLFIGYQISNTNYNSSSSTSACAKDGTKEEIGQIVPLLRQIIEAQQRQEQKKQDPRVDELLEKILNATKLLHYVPPREDIEIPTKKKYTTSKTPQDPKAFSSSPTSPTSSSNCLGWKQTIDCNGRASIDRDSLAKYLANISLIPNDQLLELPYYSKTCYDQIPTQASGLCECKNKKRHYFSCGHPLLRCKDVCSGLPLAHTTSECLQSLMYQLPDVAKFVLEKNKTEETEETEETETEEEEEIDLDTLTIPPSSFCSSFHKKNSSHTFLYNYTQIFNARYFFAINLKNNKKIIYHFLHELIRTVLLFPNRQHIFLSIVESNSNDGTPDVLVEFDKILDLLDIPHRIIVNHHLHMGNHRIEFLAQVRNAVLEPLYSSANNSYDKLIFLNDVIFCQEDIFRLLSHEGHNDIICATDWILNHEQRLGIYDLWVVRSISGDLLLNWLDFPYFSEPRSQERIKQGQTIPIMSCWNGMIIATTKPIYENNVRFRKNQPAPVDECNWSECGLFCLDYIKAGYSHILMDPQVQVGYTIEQSCRLFSDDKIPFNPDLSSPPWENFTLSDKFVCEPMRDLGGMRKGQHWERYLFSPDMNITERKLKEPYHPGPDRHLPLIT